MARDPLTEAKRLLQKHAADPRARMVGLDASLHALHDALDELERRVGSLASAYVWLLLTLDDGRAPTSMHPAQLDNLAAMSPCARDLAALLRSRVTGG